MNCGSNISDFSQGIGNPLPLSDPTRSEGENFDAVLNDVKAGRINFGFVYWPDLDGLRTARGINRHGFRRNFAVYEDRIRRLMDMAKEQYEEVRLYVFSDHGMANCDTQLDLKARIEQLPLKMGKDYAVVYDSTMARFWFFNDRARRMIAESLRTIPDGAIVPDKELERLHCLFPDRYFGELIFLVREGVLIGAQPHGRTAHSRHAWLSPERTHSYGALLTNQTEIPEEVTAIPHIYNLMALDALIAKERNGAQGPPRRRANAVLRSLAKHPNPFLPSRPLSVDPWSEGKTL